ncbi:MAG: elongation factor P [Planctomycetes bacterium]|nr:elongation factor P [Planctomycetota bacterium]
MLSPGDLKRGLIIEIDSAPCIVENVTMQTPSSRSANTIWKVRARNLKTRQKVDKAFRSGDTIAEPNFQKRPVQFLYSDQSGYHFMDLEDYNQFALQRGDIEDEADYLIDSLEGLRALVLDDEVIGIELPLTVELRIAECDPAVRGNSATARSKSAKLETGLVVQVPEHISPGDVIRVEVASGKFVGRVRK